MSGDPIDLVFVFISTVLVIFMQAGFLCLETGLARSKNSINVAFKNLTDFCLSSLLFWAVGYGIMFGSSVLGLFGASGFFLGSDPGAIDGPLLVFFFFQLAFCSTAVTIVSGAVAERMRFGGYLIIVAIISALIYPLFGHWAWGAYAGAGGAGWLKEMGFIDFAGSTVVHSIGGWVALAAIIVIGPRLGRFETEDNRLLGHSLALTCLGVLILWIGWFGFNAGSNLAFSSQVPLILVNTLLGGAAGGMAAILLSWYIDRSPCVLHGMNGCLAGLVSITANCHAVSVPEAVLIGSIGAVIAVFASSLLIRLRIDDVVGAVAVHLGPGIWGTIAVALFGAPEILATGLGMGDQLAVQALGTFVAGGISLAISLPVLIVGHRLGLMRVSETAERVGLNVAEHGATSVLDDLLVSMEQQIRSGRFQRLDISDTFTEAGVISGQYNRVVDRFNAEFEERQQANIALSAAKERAEQAARAKSHFLANMSHELRTPLNAIIGFSEVMSDKLFGSIGNERYESYIGDIHRSGKHLLSLINDVLDLSKIEAEKMSLSEERVELGELIGVCVRMASARPDAEHLRIRFALKPDLPALYADQRAVQQILINLLTNSVKFTPAGGEILVTAEVEADGAMAIAVSDTGIGMHADEIPIALEPFGQIRKDALVATKEGTGLGLPLSDAFARLHGGSLTVTSAKGKGTTVTVRFPPARVLPRGRSMPGEAPTPKPQKAMA